MSWRAGPPADRSGESAMSTSRDDSPGARQCPACSADSAQPVRRPGWPLPMVRRDLVINADHGEGSRPGRRRQRPRAAPPPERGRVPLCGVPTPPPGPVAVAIVSDGVSSAPRPDEASLTAVRDRDEAAGRGRPARATTRPGVATAVGAAPGGAGRAGRGRRRARRHLRVRGGQPGADHDLLARRQPRLLARGGLPGRQGPNDTLDITGGSRRITRDDSLAEEMVAAGLASMDEAMASPQAHVITRWLGADLPDPEAARRALPPDRARASCWSAPTGSGTTARRRPNWPPW